MKTSKKLVESSREVKITIKNPSENNAKIKKWLEDSNIPARLRGLQDTLSEDIVVLEGSIKDASTQTIIHQKKRFFFEVLDEKATLESIIKLSNKNLSTIKNALKRTYTRFYDLVDVVKVILQIENDLYQLMDEKGIQENELRQVLIDIFKEQGLTEDQIYNLLDASFKRGYILRERIEAINKRIDDIDGSLKSQIESDKNITAFKIKELKEKQDDFATKSSVEEKYSQLQSDLSKKVDSEEFQQQLLIRKKDVETLKESTSKQINSLKEEHAGLSKQQGELKEELNGKVDKDTFTQSQQEIERLERRQNDFATKSSVDEKYGQLQSDLSKKIDSEEFQRQLSIGKEEVETLKESTDAQINSLKEEIAVSNNEYKKLLNKFKRTIIAFSLTSSALLAGLIASFLI